MRKSASKFTVLGSSGFIGSRLVRDLRAAGHDCLTPGRNDPILFGQDLGHVIDCAGINDFMERPRVAIEAHAGHLVDILDRGRFDSFLYLSSARVYHHARDTVEDARLPVELTAHWEFFNLTKLLGESLCLNDSRPEVRIARLSNVYGAEQLFEPVFLPTLIREALSDGEITLTVSLASAKDYVSVDNVAWVLPRIAQSGEQRIYNVAAGRNVSNREVVDTLVDLTGCKVKISGQAPDVMFPPIRIERVAAEFDFSPDDLLDVLPRMVGDARTRLGAALSMADA